MSAFDRENSGWSYHKCRVCEENKLDVPDKLFDKNQFPNQNFKIRLTCENCGSVYKPSVLNFSLTDMIRDNDWGMVVLTFGLFFVLEKIILNPLLYIIRAIFAPHALKLVEKHRYDLEKDPKFASK